MTAQHDPTHKLPLDLTFFSIPLHSTLAFLPSTLAPTLQPGFSHSGYFKSPLLHLPATQNPTTCPTSFQLMNP